MRRRQEANRRPYARNFAAIAALGALGVGCLPNPTPLEGPPEGLTVGLAGDSLTYIAEHGQPFDLERHRLTDRIEEEDGRRVSISALPGAVTDDLATQAEWPAVPMDIIAIALGTNDMHVDEQTGEPRTPLAVAEQNLTDYITAKNPGCVVAIGIAETEPWGLDQTGPQWNSFLAQLAAENSDVIYINWAADVAAHPEYVGADEVHHTEAGQAAYVQSFRDGVNECALYLANIN